MDTCEVLAEAFSRTPEQAAGAVEGLGVDELAFRPDSDANSIAWLVWHTARMHDFQIAHVAGEDQVWTSEGWKDRFGLPFGDDDHGYGHTSAEVAQVRAGSAELLGYLQAVHDRTSRYLESLADADLDRVVDERWDPPVTLGVRLVSIANDAAQHMGQAAYVRGLIERSR